MSAPALRSFQHAAHMRVNFGMAGVSRPIFATDVVHQGGGEVREATVWGFQVALIVGVIIILIIVIIVINTIIIILKFVSVEEIEHKVWSPCGRSEGKCCWQVSFSLSLICICGNILQR